jgi:uncharacterized Tic20 family protein
MKGWLMSDNTSAPTPAARKSTAPAAKVAAKTATKVAPKTPARATSANTPEAPRVSPYAGFTPLSPSDEKLWSALIQLSGLVLNFFGPLVGYLLLRQRGPFVREHSVSALNWQLSLVIYYFVGYVLTLVLVGWLVLAAAAVLNIVFSILAAMHAHRGQLYVYPLSIKFIRA